MSRFFSPVSDIKLFIALYRIFCKEKFDIVHTMSLKIVIYGSIAAKLARTKRVIGRVLGFGIVFTQDVVSLRTIVLRFIVSQLSKIAFDCCQRVSFENPDDFNYAISKGLISREKAVLTIGCGVDLEEFSLDSLDREYLEKLRKEFMINDGDIVISMIARLINAKGVKEFLESTNAIVDKYRNVKFILVAAPDHGNPDSIPLTYLKGFTNKKIAIVAEFRYDTREIIAISDIFVFPSYLKEGVPHISIAALALKKPIVTTDNSGCRETVEEGKNGYLVPIKDSVALTEKLNILIGDSVKRRSFGEYSRKKAERCFDEKVIINRILTELYEVDLGLK